MQKSHCAIWISVGLAILSCCGPAWCGASLAQDVASGASAIDGTYELSARVMLNGEVIRPPAITALYTMDRGRGNFNLFVREKGGRLASESTISRYTLTATQYCEWIVYTTRNNLDSPGVSNTPPAVTSHCSPVTRKNGLITFAPPGEGVVTTFDRSGFTATIAGQFVDHWLRVR